MPQTIWITLEDPEQYEGISSAVQGLDGVSRVRDLREQVGADPRDHHHDA